MAVPLPESFYQDEALAGSLMAEPRSLGQQAIDLTFGRKPSERFTSAMTSLMPLTIKAVNPLAEAVLPAAKARINEVFTKLLGPGWGSRVINYLEKHPAEIKLAAEHPGRGAEGGAYAILSRRASVNPELVGTKYNGPAAAHELMHGLTALAKRGYEGAPGVKPTLGGRFDLWAGRYPKADRPAELLPMLMDLEKRAKVVDEDAFRKFIEEMTPEPKAKYIGFQEGFGKVPGYRSYNLLEDIPNPAGGLPFHTKGSTVSENTLKKFNIPYEVSE